MVSSSSSSSNNNNNGLPNQSPKPIMERSDSKNQHSTTYVRTDTSSFKEIVQKLTGPTETPNYGSFQATPSNSKNNIPPTQTMPEKQQFKLNLHARRNPHSNLNPLLPLFPSDPSSFVPSPRNLNINLSPSSNFNFTALSLGPATPHIPDQYGIPNPLPANTSTPKDAEPRLLPLFPTSPGDLGGRSST